MANPVITSTATSQNVDVQIDLTFIMPGVNPGQLKKLLEDNEEEIRQHVAIQLVGKFGGKLKGLELDSSEIYFSHDADIIDEDEIA